MRERLAVPPSRLVAHAADEALALPVANPASCQTVTRGPVRDVMLGELGLPSEPVLDTVGVDGVVRRRLDSIFGQDEIGQALEDLVA